MEEILSKPWWEFIGVVTGVILSVIAIYISIKQNKKKRLSYQIPYLYPLVDINKNVKSDFEVKYKGETIEQVCIAELQIENIGEVPIKKEDFDEPIKIEISNCTHIFNVELVDTIPENLTVGLDVKSNSNLIFINPLLMNSKDLIKLKIVFEGENSTIKLNSRIVDLKGIINKSDSIQYKSLLYGVLTIILGIVLYEFTPIPFVDFLGPIIIGVGINLISETFFERIVKIMKRK